MAANLKHEQQMGNNETNESDITR